LNEFPKESFTNHKAYCDSKYSESYNPCDKLNSKLNQSEKNLNLKDGFGIDSVKSLRERLDKRLKAISETMESIAKNDLTRRSSTNRERDRDRLDFSSIEKIKEFYSNKNNNNLITQNEISYLVNFNINETKILQEINLENENNNYLNEEIKIYTNSKNEENSLNKKETKILNTDDLVPSINKLKEKEVNIYKNYNKYKNKLGANEKIHKEENAKVNKFNDESLNQEDFNKPDFLENTSAAGIEQNSIDDVKRNFDIEENFLPNEINIRNFTSNEISKISHDNFNEGDPISDNEEANFEIKTKKSIKLAGEEETEQVQERKNYINIRIKINFFYKFLLFINIF
jgi:hypothetical protein